MFGPFLHERFKARTTVRLGKVEHRNTLARGHVDRLTSPPRVPAALSARFSTVWSPRQNKVDRRVEVLAEQLVGVARHQVQADAVTQSLRVRVNLSGDGAGLVCCVGGLEDFLRRSACLKRAVRPFCSTGTQRVAKLTESLGVLGHQRLNLRRCLS